MLEYLFAEISHKAAGETIRPHSHDFWQVEIGRAGTIVSLVAGEQFVGEPGDILFIPPNLMHSLICRSQGGRLLILKFRAASVAHRRPRQLHSLPLLAPAAALLESLVGEPPPPPLRRRQLELLLQLLVQEAYPEGPEPRRALHERIDVYIARRQGGYVTVAELAAHLGYSISHVARVFRQEHGESLKRYLDRRRAHVSENLLRYSELTIAEIAARQEFPDLPAFSRFVRTHLGAAPRTLRQG